MPDPPRLEAEFRDAPSISGRIFCVQKTVLRSGRSIVFAYFIFASSAKALQKAVSFHSTVYKGIFLLSLQKFT
jgi:hypothetical protein